MIDGKIKQTFTSQTDKTWREFSEEAFRYFAAPRSEVWMGYRFGRETAMSYLRFEEQWTEALERLRAKAKAARQVAVLMEIKNVVSHAAYNKEGT
jgi:hypothetical protein